MPVHRPTSIAGETPKLRLYREILEQQSSGSCLASACTAPRDGDEYLCRAHWLALPAESRREIIRARNAHRAAPRDEECRRRFQHAWRAAAIAINCEPKEVSAVG
jgi:hypothetical protein